MHSALWFLCSRSGYLAGSAHGSIICPWVVSPSRSFAGGLSFSTACRGSLYVYPRTAGRDICLNEYGPLLVGSSLFCNCAWSSWEWNKKSFWYHWHPDKLWITMQRSTAIWAKHSKWCTEVLQAECYTSVWSLRALYCGWNRLSATELVWVWATTNSTSAVSCTRFCSCYRFQSSIKPGKLTFI